MLLRLVSGLALINCLALAAGNPLLQDDGDEELTFIRDKRSSDVCKYSKGDWSTCNPLTKLETRQDRVRAGSSAADCPQTRIITRNCNKDKSLKPNSFKKGLCVYAKARDVDWSDCQNGVRQKLLKLLSSKPDAGCPNVKVISKKCKNKKAKKFLMMGSARLSNDDKSDKNVKKEKKRERKEKKAEKQKRKQEKKENKISEKCDFGNWSEFSACTNNKKSRSRQITRGGDLKICRKEATQIQQC